MNVTEWNTYLLGLFIPLDILLVLFLVVGIVGNIIIIYVYGFKLKKIKDGQSFIPYLAVTDLLGSIICSLFGLSLTLMPVTYDLDTLCKSGWIFGTIATMMSVFLLVTIAIQRYIKVCRQQGHILTLQRKRTLMILALIMSVLLAVPSAATYGTVPFTSSERNLTGQICGKLSTGNWSLVYDIILSIAVGVSCGLLIILYVLIGRETYRYIKKGTNLRLKNQNTSDFSQDDVLGNTKSTLDTEDKINDTIEIQHFETLSKEFDVNEKSADLVICPGKDSSKVCKKSKSKRKKSNMEKVNQRAISKITQIFMVMTIIFLICSLPKLTTIFLETLIPNFWEKFTDVERVILMFVHQGYILNNVVNPFIYTALDKKFKAEMKNILWLIKT